MHMRKEEQIRCTRSWHGWPDGYLEANRAGRAAATSPMPPVLDHGATSVETKTTYQLEIPGDGSDRRMSYGLFACCTHYLERVHGDSPASTQKPQQFCLRPRSPLAGRGPTGLDGRARFNASNHPPNRLTDTSGSYSRARCRRIGKNGQGQGAMPSPKEMDAVKG